MTRGSTQTSVEWHMLWLLEKCYSSFKVEKDITENVRRRCRSLGLRDQAVLDIKNNPAVGWEVERQNEPHMNTAFSVCGGQMRPATIMSA